MLSGQDGEVFNSLKASLTSMLRRVFGSSKKMYSLYMTKPVQ